MGITSEERLLIETEKDLPFKQDEIQARAVPWRLNAEDVEVVQHDQLYQRQHLDQGEK